MDPFSAQGELLNLHNAFHQGQYNAVLAFDTRSLSAENRIPARVLTLRARIALGQAEDVLAELEGGEEEPDFVAVAAFAHFTSGDSEAATKAIDRLLAEAPENTTVQVLGGTILQGVGRSEDALTLLAKHEGSLEAVMLVTQIHLQQNRTDLALKEVQAARRWAQDSLLVNLAESWVGLRVGGEKYREAFYVFEELAQAPSTSSPKSFLGQAIAEVHLGRLPEAEAALQRAMEQDASNADIIANAVVASVLSGKDPEELISSLRDKSPGHLLLRDLQDKSAQFNQAAAKYSPRAAA
ncbi:MAG: hypothetical protein M1826_004264 [Phylliscum demangeonii]|nr:MAG: hypothetical protein M1826_004264 [Phylliscum demangeonii]